MKRLTVKVIFLFGCYLDVLGCVSVGVAEEVTQSETESCGLQPVSFCHLEKHFSVVIVATWGDCGLMSVSDYIISSFSNLRFSQWVLSLC